MTILWNSLEVDGRSWKQIFKVKTLRSNLYFIFFEAYICLFYSDSYSD